MPGDTAILVKSKTLVKRIRCNMNARISPKIMIYDLTYDFQNVCFQKILLLTGMPHPF